jgi:hypothetical protein
MSGRSGFGGCFLHYVLQLVAVFPRTPALRLTPAAQAALRSRMAAITEFKPVASLSWASSVTVGNEQRGPQWIVGYYNIASRPWGRVTSIDGIPFVFVQRDAVVATLNGATLDFRDGRFVVNGARK